MDAWEILVASSTIEEGDAWTHLNNLGAFDSNFVFDSNTCPPGGEIITYQLAGAFTTRLNTLQVAVTLEATETDSRIERIDGDTAINTIDAVSNINDVTTDD